MGPLLRLKIFEGRVPVRSFAIDLRMKYYNRGTGGGSGVGSAVDVNSLPNILTKKNYLPITFFLDETK